MPSIKTKMAYQNTPTNPRGALKVIPIIHLALLAGQTLFAIVAYFQARNVRLDLQNTKDPFFFVAPLMAIGGFIASNIIFKQRLNSLGTATTARQKVTIYQSGLIVRYALLEGPSLFGIVCFMLTGNLFYLIISGLIIVYFLFIRPSKDSIDTDLNLSFDEKAELEGIQ